MEKKIPDFSLLSTEQLEAISESQKEIFLNLGKEDQQFFASNFAPATLGSALERKWEAMQARLQVAAHAQRAQESLRTKELEYELNRTHPWISGTDLAAEAAGAVGLVGLGVLARKIAPDGTASWRGVTPHDLVNPLLKTFARQERTEIWIDPPMEPGNLKASVLLRTTRGLIPALAILLTPLEETTQVQVSKVSSQTMMESVKEGSQKLVDLVQDSIRLSRGGVFDLIDLAGRVVYHGADLAQIVTDLDLEDKAWEAILQTAEPLQAIYDEKKAIEKQFRLQLESAWDDYYSCPKCRVEFGADDLECRVCGAARPEMPFQADPRKV